MGLSCISGHCGIPIPDGGACSLDPGGTPCSQCVVGSCCNETQNCLNSGQCSNSLSCFQSCVVGNNPPAQCAAMCCTDSNCTVWTNCVEAHCAAPCL